MDDVVRRFFEGIGGRHEDVPATIAGRLRFDLVDGGPEEHWLVTFAHGTVSVVESDAEADCIVRTDKGTMAAIIEGRMNAMAALLRGALLVQGDTLLIAVFRDLLIAPEAPPAEVRAGAFTGSRP